MSYLKGLIAAHLRRIDFLRVKQIMKHIQGYNHNQLINIASDGKTLIDAIILAQNQLHQETRQTSFEISKEDFKIQLGIGNGNVNENSSDIVNDIGNENENIAGNSNVSANLQQLSQPSQPSQLSQPQIHSQLQSQSQSQQELSQSNNNNNNNNTNDNENKESGNDGQSQQPMGISPNFDSFRRNENKQEKVNNENNNDDVDPEKLVELTKELEGQLLQSWHDFEYSHLRTFQYANPQFSTKTELYDNSAQTVTLFDADPQFNLKDMVIHVAQETRNDPRDYIRLRFSSPSIVKKDGNVDFLLRLGAFVKETGGIWEFVHKKDIVQTNYRKNDFDYAMENDQKQYDAQVREWEVLHNKVGRNFNRPDHPGPQPVFKNPNELSLCEKIIDTSNSTYNIQTSDGTSRRIKRGIIHWNENVQFQNSIDYYFLNTAEFAQQQDWEERMINQFYDWQQQRQNVDINHDVEMEKDTTFQIFKPITNCTIRINIPMSELDDCGNPVKLHDQVIKILKYHNHMETKKNGKNIFPIDRIKSISRSKKSKNIIDKVWKRWVNWKFNNQERYDKMDNFTKLLIQEKRVLEQIFTSNIYIEFDKWLDDIPSHIDYALGKWDIQLVSTKSSDLEKRLLAFKQCENCGDIRCKKNRCRNFKKTVYLLANKYQVDKNVAKKWIVRFCHNCGQTGGHRGKCMRRCKFCGSHNHNSQVSPECPYWNAWGILTLLYNEYFVRNQIVRNDYKKNTTRLDSYWILNENLSIEKTSNNANVYEKIVRQNKILKYLCNTCDVFCVEDEGVRLIDKLHDAWMDETQEKEEDGNENENKNNDDDVDDFEDGMENKNERKENGKEDKNNKNGKNEIEDERKKQNKQRYHKRGKRKTIQRCFNCEKNIIYLKTYKKCKCSYIYCSSCWTEVFMEDDEIDCYGCQKVANGEMNIVTNENPVESENDESDIDWENQALLSDSDEESDSLESIGIQTESKNNNIEEDGENENGNDVDIKTNKENKNEFNETFDMSQLQYDVNKKNKNNKQNRFKKQKTNNNNFNKKAKNRKFKIVRNKNKNKQKNNNTSTTKNLRIKRKKKHEQDKQKQQHKSNKRKNEKKQQIMKVKEEKIKKLMGSNTKLTKENIKFIGNDTKIIKAALGIRIEVLLKDTEIQTNQIIELINTSSVDEILALINDKNIESIVSKRFEINNDENENENKENKDKSGDQPDPRDRDKEKERGINKYGVDNDGFGILSETRGLGAGILVESGDEKGDSENEDEDVNRNDSNLGYGSNRNDGSDGKNGNANVNGSELDIFKINGISDTGIPSIDASKYNMGFGMGFDADNGVENNNSIDGKIDALQRKSKSGVEKVVDNEAYTANNPSMAEL